MNAHPNETWILSAGKEKERNKTNEIRNAKDNYKIMKHIYERFEWSCYLEE